MKTLEQKNAETVTAFIEDANNRRLLEETGQFFALQMAAAFTDRRYAVDEILAQGDKVIARIMITAVHSGQFVQYAPTGKIVKVTQFREFRVSEGNITEQWGWLDTSTLLPQLQA
ncbi:ester cyclase [Paenibacillus aestuarii]|uniref:Ester cyclase n=1 Tax=Paenibacillus aestuarii TaxID=516965 RepID=A0ABW0K8V2_9BACL|nr:ester cyclase [Paenibacillus aestuarii]